MNILNNNKRQIDPLVKSMLESANSHKYTSDDIYRLHTNQIAQTEAPEFIDQYIYTVEHGYVKDFFVTVDWEFYKVRVGYYNRHPERKGQSQEFTFRRMGIPNPFKTN